MDGWMEVWMGRRVDGWVDGERGGWMEGRIVDGGRDAGSWKGGETAGRWADTHGLTERG